MVEEVRTVVAQIRPEVAADGVARGVAEAAEKLRVLRTAGEQTDSALSRVGKGFSGTAVEKAADRLMRRFDGLYRETQDYEKSLSSLQRIMDQLSFAQQIRAIDGINAAYKRLPESMKLVRADLKDLAEGARTGADSMQASAMLIKRSYESVAQAVSEAQRKARIGTLGEIKFDAKFEAELQKGIGLVKNLDETIARVVSNLRVNKLAPTLDVAGFEADLSKFQGKLNGWLAEASSARSQEAFNNLLGVNAIPVAAAAARSEYEAFWNGIFARQEQVARRAAEGSARVQQALSAFLPIMGPSTGNGVNNQRIGNELAADLEPQLRARAEAAQTLVGRYNQAGAAARQLAADEAALAKAFNIGDVEATDYAAALRGLEAARRKLNETQRDRDLVAARAAQAQVDWNQTLGVRDFEQSSAAFKVGYEKFWNDIFERQDRAAVQAAAGAARVRQALALYLRDVTPGSEFSTGPLQNQRISAELTADLGPQLEARAAKAQALADRYDQLGAAARGLVADEEALTKSLRVGDLTAENYAAAMNGLAAAKARLDAQGNVNLSLQSDARANQAQLDYNRLLGVNDFAEASAALSREHERFWTQWAARMDKAEADASAKTSRIQAQYQRILDITGQVRPAPLRNDASGSGERADYERMYAELLNQRAAAAQGVASKYSQVSAAALRLAEDEKKLTEALRQGDLTAEAYTAAMRGLAEQKKLLSAQSNSTTNALNIQTGATENLYQRGLVLRAGLLNTFQSLAAGQSVMSTLFIQSTQLVGAFGNMNLKLLGLVAGASVAIAAFAGVTLAVARTGDAAVMAQARMEQFVGSAATAARIYENLQQLGQSTGVSAAEAGGVFSRLLIGGEQIGATTAQMERLLETFQKLGVLGSATTQELTAGMRQFTQALGKGKLDGDEFRSVLENLPEVVRLIGRNLGKSTEQLREMGAQGQLTSRLVFDAMLRGSTEVDERFARLPVTMTRAFNMAKVAMEGVLVEIDRMTGASRRLAEVLAGVANRLMEFRNWLRSINDPGNTQVEVDRASSALAAQTAEAERLKTALDAARASQARLVEGGPERQTDSRGRPVPMTTMERQLEGERRREAAATVVALERQLAAANAALEQTQRRLQTANAANAPRQTAQANQDSEAAAASSYSQGIIEQNRRLTEQREILDRLLDGLQTRQEIERVYRDQSRVVAEQAARTAQEIERLGNERERMRRAGIATAADEARWTREIADQESLRARLGGAQLGLNRRREQAIRSLTTEGRAAERQADALDRALDRVAQRGQNGGSSPEIQTYVALENAIARYTGTVRLSRQDEERLRQAREAQSAVLQDLANKYAESIVQIRDRAREMEYENQVRELEASGTAESRRQLDELVLSRQLESIELQRQEALRKLNLDLLSREGEARNLVLRAIEETNEAYNRQVAAASSPVNRRSYQEALGQQQRALDNAVRESADFFYDAFEGKSWDIAKVLGQALKRGIADGLAEEFVRPLLRPVISTIVGTGAGSGLLGGLTNELGMVAGAVGLSGGGAAATGGAAAAGGGGIMSALGLGGAGFSLSGLFNTPLWGQGPLQGPMPDGSVISGLGGGTTLGSLVPGAALGFGAGYLTSGLTAKSNAQKTNGTIGSGAGALAGAALGSLIEMPMLGGILGGAAGGALGGLIGPSKSFSGGDVVLEIQGDGMAGISRVVSDKFDMSETTAKVRQEIEQFNATMQQLGIKLTNLGDARVGGGSSAFPTSLSGALGQGGAGFVSTRGDPLVNKVLEGVSDGNEALSRTKWVMETYKALSATNDGAANFQKTLDELNGKFSDAIAKANQYGLSITELQANNEKEIDKAWKTRWNNWFTDVKTLEKRTAVATGNAVGAARADQEALNASQNLARLNFADEMAAKGYDQNMVNALQKAFEKALEAERDQAARAVKDALAGVFDRFMELRMAGAVNDRQAQLEIQRDIALNPTYGTFARQRESLGQYLAGSGLSDAEKINWTAALEKAISAQTDNITRSLEDWNVNRLNSRAKLYTRMFRAEQLVEAGSTNNSTILYRRGRADLVNDQGLEFNNLKAEWEKLGISADALSDRLAYLNRAHAAELQLYDLEYRQRQKAANDNLVDREFYAKLDTNTKEGALKAFDRRAQREREQAQREGLVNMVQLEKTLAAERLNVLKQFEAAVKEWGKNIYDYLAGLKNNSVGGYYSPTDAFAASRTQYASDLQGSRAGNLDAMNRLLQTTQTYVENARTMYGSTEAFFSVVNQVRTDLTQFSAFKDYIKTLPNSGRGTFETGGRIPMFQEGGMIAQGIWGKDSVLGMLATGGAVGLAGGEYVVNAASSAQWGGTLAAINEGSYGQGFEAVCEELYELRKEVALLRVERAQDEGKANALRMATLEATEEGTVAVKSKTPKVVGGRG